MTRTRLTALGPGKWLLLALGVGVSGLCASYCLPAVVAPGEPWWSRAVALVFAVLFVGPWIVLPATARARLRVLDVDARGVRLRRGDGTAFTDLAWSEVAAVGVMVDEEQARHAASGGGWAFNLIMHAVPPWLEVVPTGTAAVRAHPELGPLVEAGDGQPPRWMIRLNEGWARRPDLDAAMTRTRPDLWHGVRHGSTPRTLLSSTVRRRAFGLEPPAPHVEPAPVVPRRHAPVAGPGPERVVELPRWPRLRRWLVGMAAVTAGWGVLVLVEPRADLMELLPMVVLTAMGALASFDRLGRPRRLVADDATLRPVRGTRRVEWRVPWSDAAAVRMERRGERSTVFIRPTGPVAVDAHPALLPCWQAGLRIEWRLPLGVVGDQERAVRGLVAAHAEWSDERAPAG